MITPLTNAILSACRNKPATTGYLAMAAHAETLELDRAALMEALKATWRVIDAAGLHNLTNGVQLGQTVWFVKASDAKHLSQSALSAARANFP